MENLESVIESVVFVAGEPVLISDLCYKFEVKPKEVETAVKNLQKKYNEKSGIKLLCFNNKLQFSSNPENVDFVYIYIGVSSTNVVSVSEWITSIGSFSSNPKKISFAIANRNAITMI